MWHIYSNNLFHAAILNFLNMQELQIISVIFKLWLSFLRNIIHIAVLYPPALSICHIPDRINIITTWLRNATKLWNGFISFKEKVTSN